MHIKARARNSAQPVTEGFIESFMVKVTDSAIIYKPSKSRMTMQEVRLLVLQYTFHLRHEEISIERFSVKSAATFQKHTTDITVNPINDKMVKLYHIIAWLLFGQLAVASTQNASLSIIPGQDSHNRVKRWFSLQKPNEGGVNGGRGTWPAMCPGSDRPAQVISYCFEDQRSERRLKDLLNHAVAGWALALYPHSSLEIDLDNAQSTICSNSNRPDALHIIDNSRDNDDRWNFSPQCRTAASLGYLYGSDARGRHHLDFCALAPGFEEESKPFALADMIHELGHVMGLQHEHQRDDAYKYLDYKCSNLLGYQAGVNAAMADPARIFDPPYAWSREQRVFAM